MKRNLNKLVNTTYDLLIIGGGIHGAVLAWQAVLCNISVALVEKEDFAHSTSSNSQKMIHGGLRYLQQLNFHRMRQSIWSRKRLLEVAPHLVHPLMCLMPIYGHGLKGKEIMWLGLRINDLVSFDRNDLTKKSKSIPNGEILSISETNRFIPHLEQRNLKGSARWYDALCSNTERLVVGFVRTACNEGSVAANYVKAIKIIVSGDRITGVKARDQLTGNEFDIRAKRVANCAGPWVNELLSNSSLNYQYPQKHISGINIVVDKIFPFNTAVGLKNKTGKKGLYFVVPWREKSIVGTEYFSYKGYPDNYKSSEEECMQLIKGFNQTYPYKQLKIGDVDFIHYGLLPVNNASSRNENDVIVSKKFKIIDHGLNGIKGLVSVIGVKYTTALYVSVQVLKHFFSMSSIDLVNTNQPLIGGDIEDYASYKKHIINKWKDRYDEMIVGQLVENYGTEVEKVIQLGESGNSFVSSQKTPLYSVFKGQTLFAVREEMAIKLSDVIFRRTDIGSLKRPGKDILNQISHIMAEELGWTENRRITEIKDVNGFYPSFIA